MSLCSSAARSPCRRSNTPSRRNDPSGSGDRHWHSADRVDPRAALLRCPVGPARILFALRCSRAHDQALAQKLFDKLRVGWRAPLSLGGERPVLGIEVQQHIDLHWRRTVMLRRFRERRARPVSGEALGFVEEDNFELLTSHDRLLSGLGAYYWRYTRDV